MLYFLADVVERNWCDYCGDNRAGRGCAWEAIDDRNLTEYIAFGERCHNEPSFIFIERYLDHTGFNNIGAISRVAFAEDVFVRIERCLKLG